MTGFMWQSKLDVESRKEQDSLIVDVLMGVFLVSISFTINLWRYFQFLFVVCYSKTIVICKHGGGWFYILT